MNNNISENELALCRQMGVAPEDYLKTRESENVAQSLNRDQLNNQITSQELAICRQFGVSPKDYQKERDSKKGAELVNRAQLNTQIRGHVDSPPKGSLNASYKENLVIAIPEIYLPFSGF
jgi:hypothetical protein